MVTEKFVNDISSLDSLKLVYQYLNNGTVALKGGSYHSVSILPVLSRNLWRFSDGFQKITWKIIRCMPYYSEVKCSTEIEIASSVVEIGSAKKPLGVKINSDELW